jgi:hypothetical protein
MLINPRAIKNLNMSGLQNHKFRILDDPIQLLKKRYRKLILDKNISTELSIYMMNSLNISQNRGINNAIRACRKIAIGLEWKWNCLVNSASF